MNFQDMIRHLEEYWANMDCVILQPYNSEVGAGTFNPATFLRVLDNDDWRTAYLEISKRPKDGRYGENPNRMQQFYQYQVVIQPAPDNIQDIYIKSLEAIGIETQKHDIRFVEDDWESPTLGAKGLGWEVWLDGMEITQFTYFQQMASMKIENVPVELTYGLERIAMFIQQKNSVQELQWSDSMKWSDVMLESEKQFCIFNFDEADTEYIREQFEKNESEVKRLLDKDLVYPAYDYLIKATHAFNLLDARGAVSPKERQGYIKRIRDLARATAKQHTRDNDE
ncbi:MAG: glycine--tRNA ligase subunit alpha [bacterium]